MIQPEASVVDLINKALRKNFCLVLYKDPWNDYFRYLIAKEAKPVYSLEELDGNHGWVFTPFRMDANTPGYLLTPEISGIDWFNLGQALSHSMWKSQRELPVALEPPFTDSQERYEEAFDVFQRAIQGGEFPKLVLSRCKRHVSEEALSPAELFYKACASYPRMMTYLCHIPQAGTWMGSTPEILLQGDPCGLETVSLAGTMPLSNTSDEASWSNKNKQEQRFVSSYIKETLKAMHIRVKEKGPFTARAGHLLHIKTEFNFNYDKMSKMGTLLSRLYPTPAVNGLPKVKAKSFILKHERLDRKFYTGICGWMEPEAITDLYVNLRCMQLFDKSADLYAGGGILHNSELKTEWEETNEKLRTMEAVFEK